MLNVDCAALIKTYFIFKSPFIKNVKYDKQINSFWYYIAGTYKHTCIAGQS